MNNLTVKTLLKTLPIFSLVAILLSFSPKTEAATFDISGNARFGSNMFSNLDLNKGQPEGTGSTSSFLEHRLLLRPDVVIDDRFTLKSELILLSNFKNDSLDKNVQESPEGAGTILGADRSQFNQGQILYVRRAWIDWASDWGIFRFGRQPKSWGLGLLYHSGEDSFDDYGTTVDRVGFEALVGSLNLNFGYEKAFEGNINSDVDDAETYEVSVHYANPEDFFNIGLLYARNIRGVGANLGLNSSHDLSIFTQKKWGDFQIGAEFVTLNENHRDTNFGALLQTDYSPGNFGLGFDLAFASAGSTSNFTFHPNYKPFLIMFNQSVLTKNNSRTLRGGQQKNSAFGSDFGLNNGAGGAVMAKTHLSHQFSNKTYTLGTEIGYALLTEQGSTQSKNLGLEWDLHLTQKWYENFKTVYAAGILFPGKGFGPQPKTAWGVQLRGALDF